MEKTDQKILEEIIRVDHAGERGAIKIYEGQLLALQTIRQDQSLKNKIEEFSGCTASTLEIIDKSELLKSLNDNVSSCKDVNFKLFGISLAGINFLLSLLIVIYSLKIMVYEKN